MKIMTTLCTKTGDHSSVVVTPQYCCMRPSCSRESCVPPRSCMREKLYSRLYGINLCRLPKYAAFGPPFKICLPDPNRTAVLVGGLNDLALPKCLERKGAGATTAESERCGLLLERDFPL